MPDDNRKNIKVEAPVKERFDAGQPADMNQSEFVAALLDGAEFRERPSADEVREIVREELRRVLPDELVSTGR